MVETVNFSGSRGQAARRRFEEDDLQSNTNIFPRNQGEFHSPNSRPDGECDSDESKDDRKRKKKERKREKVLVAVVFVSIISQ